MPALAMDSPLVSVRRAYVCVQAVVPSRHACLDSNNVADTRCASAAVSNSNNTVRAALPGLRGQRLGGAGTGSGRQGPAAARW